MHRRDLLLAGALVVGAGGVLRACGSRAVPDRRRADSMAGMETIRYGDHHAQLLELSRPSGTSRGVVVVVHGGFWLAEYDLSLGRPLAGSLVEQGWTAANLEYRRVGDGGGWPTTFDDVAAGIDALADVDGLDTTHVLTLGHSAGGHLAVWAAGRAGGDERWADVRVPVTGAVSQAGVLDLAGARSADLGDGAVSRFLGDDPAREAEADPLRRVPLHVPVRCVHATGDVHVPLEQSQAYVAAATRAGADATLTEVDGDHFTVIDVDSEAWRATLELLTDLVR